MDKRGAIKRIGELNEQVTLNRIVEKETRMAEMSEIILRMDDYNDIFSDFDPRPYSKRALSDDFLEEAQKASTEKTAGAIEVRLLFSKKIKDSGQEEIIKKRLHAHFARHYELLFAEKSKTIRNGVYETIIGGAMLAFSTYISTLIPQTLWDHVIYILLQPAGWFISWYGLDEIFYSSKRLRQQLDFYEKMHRSKIVFDYF